MNIELEKSGRTSVFSIKREVPTPRIRELAWEIKSFVFLDLGEKHKASLVTRKVEDFCLPILEGFTFDKKLSYADTYLTAWKILKDRGFPVVETVRKVDEERVATTNLAADLTTSIYDQKIDKDQYRDTKPMDKDFVKIPVQELVKKTEDLLKQANKNGVKLATDGPFHIVIDPDGSWYILLLDIGKISIFNNPRDLDDATKANNRYYLGEAV